MDLTDRIMQLDLGITEERDRKLCEILLTELGKMEDHELVPYLNAVSIDKNNRDMRVVLRFPLDGLGCSYAVPCNIKNHRLDGPFHGDGKSIVKDGI